jgi:Flp pilus assembly protein TadD
LQLEPANGTIRLNLALAFYKEGNFADAAHELEQLHAGDRENVRIVTLLGDCELRLGRAEDAARVAVPLANAHAEDLDLAFVAGSALIRAGKRREGLSFIERVAKQGHSSDAYLLAGSTWLEVNEFEAARKDLEAALELDPALPRIHTLLGIAKERNGEAQAAEPELRRALEINPEDFEANLYLGAILYKRRDLVAARGFLERALKIDSHSALARYELGMVQSGSGEFAAAVANLEAASSSDPTWLEPHVELAALYYKLHRPADGARERELVDKLSAEQQKQGPRSDLGYGKK